MTPDPLHPDPLHPDPVVTDPVVVDSRGTRVQLLTKPGCHLCDDVRPLLVQALEPFGLGFDEVDITTDDALYAEYWTDIPVVLVDGVVIAVHRVGPADLIALTEALTPQQPSPAPHPAP